MLSADEVLNQSFTSTQLRRGYDESEVDAFLDRVVAQLRYYESLGVPRGPEVPVPPAGDPPHRPSRARPATDPYRPQRDPLAEPTTSQDQAASGAGAVAPDTGAPGSRIGRWLRGDPDPR